MNVKARSSGLGLSLRRLCFSTAFCLVGCEAHQVRNPGLRRTQAPSTEVRAASLPSAIEDGFHSPNFVLSVQIQNAGSSVYIEGAELDPVKSELDTWDMTEPTTFTLERIALRHANDWYLAGSTASGDLRIERWELIHTPGAYYTELAAAGTAPGTAVSTPPLIVGIDGDTYVSPSARTRPVFSKTLVYQGASLGRIVRMVVDPDGRYLVMQLASPARTYELRQFVFAGGSTSSLTSVHLGATVASPFFATIVSIGLCDHPRRGRALFVQGEDQNLFLWDLTNDAQFESQVLLTWQDSARNYPYEIWSRIY